MNKGLLTAVCVLSLCGFGHRETPAASAYFDTVRSWQNRRSAGLRSPDGWLTLVGLFWLKPGENTIGSDPANDFVLPKSAPSRLGALRLQHGDVLFSKLAGNSVRVNAKPIDSPVKLSYDASNPDVVGSGSISFFVIKRGDKLGIRAQDADSRELKSSPDLQFFAIKPELHFAKARFVPDARKITILNVLGQTSLEESPGVVEFNYHRETYRLRPLYEGKDLFFLFKDPTNKSSTYQAGRMLSTPPPRNGVVDLDFNRAYNPPCAFTPYATCPLPPRENNLSFPVEAGEKRYHRAAPEGAS